MPDPSAEPSVVIGLPADYLDLYKLAVEMADRVSSRRQAANTFFLTLNTSLAGVIGLGHIFLPAATGRALLADRFSISMLAIVGLLLSGVWWVLLRSYRDLNTAKYQVILKMEERLSVKVFGDEWGILRKDPVRWWRMAYAELGSVERRVPAIFAFVYIAMGIHNIVT